MSEDLIKINQALGKQIEAKQLILENINSQLEIAIVGLEAIITEGSDNLNIAEKTIIEINNCKESFILNL